VDRDYEEMHMLRKTSKWSVDSIIIIIIIIIIIFYYYFLLYASNIPGHHEVKELQKTAILGTAHILRKVVT